MSGWKAAPLEDPSELRNGDYVRKRGSQTVYEVVEGPEPRVAKFVILMNPSEWERVVIEEEL